MYNIPNEYYVRLHHPRPRFKRDPENVLLFMASEISKMPTLPKKEFVQKLNDIIKLYPGNAVKVQKTINNWRTEIPALFGFVTTDKDNNMSFGLRAKELADNQDLTEAFKKFLYTFQYPSGSIKPDKVLEMVKSGVHFKPVQYILKVLKAGEKIEGKHIGITKGEACHCVFNDLRCVRDNEDPTKVWKRIRENRNNDIKYNMKGDIIRYAGDIIDYMKIANLLITYDSKTYYINELENESILKFLNSTEWYSAYDTMIENRMATTEEISACEQGWFAYINRDLNDTDFSTDILAFISSSSKEYEELKKQSLELFDEKLQNESEISTKDIGDMGENLVHGHECQRVKNGGRADLVHLIQHIPTQFAVGYDIQSVELDATKRYIEVKTTISSKPLHFNKIHLTPNEWSTATSLKERYFVYRLAINKKEKRLFIIQDPVRLYKNDIIDMNVRNGAELTFDVDKAGSFEELLAWNG